MAASGEIGRMVSRSAYAQLGYSPLLLAGTVAAMVLIFLMRRRCSRFSATALRRRRGCALGCSWRSPSSPCCASTSVSPLWGVALPAIAAAYTLFTVQSALEVWRGRGGMWKGRAQAMAGDT